MLRDERFAGWINSEVAQTNDKTGFYAAIVFFIWPLAAVVSAFRNYRSSWAKNIFWAFVAYYGLSFAIGLESQDSDIVRYVAEVKYLYGKQMSLHSALAYYQQSGEIDILRTILAIIVSRFTDNQIVLTSIYGIIFGFFYSRNLWYLLGHIKGKLRPITILLFICFFLVIPMWNLTTFRMWTAAHIFVYGSLPFLFEGKRKGILIAVSSVLVHYSFIIPVGVLLGYIFIGNRLTVYFIFFIATFFITNINLNVFNNFVETYAPEAIQERTSGYRGEKYVESYREGSNEGVVWYAVVYRDALTWTVTGLLIFLFIKGRVFFREHTMWLRLFSFILLFYGVANVFGSLPSGGRFISIANMMALALIILYIQNIQEESVAGPIFLFTVAPLLLFIIVSIRVGLYSFSAASVVGNPVVAIFFNQDQLSLNDVIRMII